MSRINFITGAAGFIGSTLADRLLAAGERVVAYDNFSTGQRRFIADALEHPLYSLVEGDILDEPALARAMRGAERVWHLAANADVRFGLAHPRRDLEQNTIATHNVLEAMRATGVAEIAFASSGAVYGEPTTIPTPEDAPFPVQTSLYGASKAAGEALVQAYAEGFGVKGRIFRFVSVLGQRYTHGHVFDFCKQLRADPSSLRILGDGSQRKSYMHVDDCVAAMRLAMEKAEGGLAVLNLGVDGYVTVSESAAAICRRMGVDPVFEYSGGRRGWVGDAPFVWLDASRARSLGWRPACGIIEAVEKTVDWLLANPWAFAARA